MTPDGMRQETQSKAQEMQTENMNPGIERDRQLIIDAKKKGGLSIFKTY